MAIAGVISSTAQAYAMALKDPWDAPLVGVPSYPPLPSAKYRVWCSGSADIGTVGVGGLIVYPGNLCVNDVNTVVATTSTNVNNYTPLIADGNTSVSNSNSPFANASLGNNLQWRLVACSLKVWYTGSDLSLAGTYSALAHPDNESIGHVTQPTLNSYPTRKFSSFDSSRKPIYITWVPTRPSDLDFQSDRSLVTPSITVLFTGPVGTPAWVAYEVCGIVEYVGSLAPNRTRNIADPDGLGAVLGAVETGDQITIGSPVSAVKGIWSQAREFIAAESGPIARALGRFAVDMAVGGRSRVAELADRQNALVGIGPTVTDISKRVDVVPPALESAPASQPVTSADHRYGVYRGTRGAGEHTVQTPPSLAAVFQTMEEAQSFIGTQIHMAPPSHQHDYSWTIEPYTA